MLKELKFNLKFKLFIVIFVIIAKMYCYEQLNL